MYIQSATLNGEPWNKPWFSQSDIAAGATLVLVMGPQPNVKWGSSADAAPPSMTPRNNNDPLLRSKRDNRCWLFECKRVAADSLDCAGARAPVQRAACTYRAGRSVIAAHSSRIRHQIGWCSRPQASGGTHGIATATPLPSRLVMAGVDFRTMASDWNARPFK